MKEENEEFSFDVIFAKIKSKKIALSVFEFAKSKKTIKEVIAVVFDKFKDKKKEELFVSGVMLGKYIAFNDLSIRTEDESEENTRYIG